MLINLMISKREVKELRQRVRVCKRDSSTAKESFARAFVQMFGKSPTEYKKIIIFEL